MIEPSPLIVMSDLDFHLNDTFDSDARQLTNSVNVTGMVMHAHSYDLLYR